MFQIPPLETLLIVISAVWRMSSLLANEDGPFHFFKWIRERAKHLTNTNRFFAAWHLSEGLECEWCNSLLIGISITAAWFFLGDMAVWIAMPFAVSTWVIFLKYVIQTLEQVRQFLENKVDDQVAEKLLSPLNNKERK